MIQPEAFSPSAAKAAIKSETALTGMSAREVDAKIRKDFRYFLYLMWKHLGLPEPTRLQYNIAYWLQHGPDRQIIMAFRGVAKSWITAAYVLWLLYCDPQKKILVVSASLKRSIAFTNFCLMLIRQWPLLEHLAPRMDQRQSSVMFDVGPALPDQSPSVHAAGITGQIVGFRADEIVPDDIETNDNSKTTVMRDTLKNNVKEFDAIIKPGGKIKYLGTPQTENSIYITIIARGYTCRIWPARYPDEKQVAAYGDKLAPFIKKIAQSEIKLVGKSTEPTRFSDEDLFKRELSWGRSGFALQFMLDTSLADGDRYPIKLRNLIVMSLDPKKGPESLAWSNDAYYAHKELPVLGMDGDGYYGPVSEEKRTMSPYNSTIMIIDPSGGGADETGFSIMSELHARLFLHKTGGFLDGFGPATLQALAQLCVEYRVNRCLIESNFGDGMWTALFRPKLVAAWEKHNKSVQKALHGGTTIEEVTASRATKEERIISALASVVKAHQLVVNTDAIREDYESLSKIDGENDRQSYSAFYQMSRITNEKDCLAHEDRLETISVGALHYAPALGVAPEESLQAAEERRMDEELEALFAEADEIQGVGRAPGGLRPGLRGGGLRH
ncbi:phage terminase large subunit [Taklimakanibacter albus]|uniref:Phage terminase large subunit n=1 Tax=Taklimakanibacter albus TaxID=2800327 RepID=A0ACC5RG07_9HYPH|nr:phage terminase large subunit [Aestuariivirga sp. YIM B02566]